MNSMPESAERLLVRVPDRVLAALDSWRFWMGVAYVGLAGVLIGLYVLFENQSNETARRVAIQRSAAQASLSSCVNGVRNAPVVRGFIAGQRALDRNSIISTEAALAAAHYGDPLIPIRQASLNRLLAAQRNTDKLERLIKATTPTKKKCNQLALELALPPPYKQPR